MLYKILLTLELQEVSQNDKALITQKLENLAWHSNTIWTSEKQVFNLLSAKLSIERDLQLMFKTCGLQEIKYAFQLSLGDVSTGKLKQNQI
jgi:hypothetical protein